jgi:hypothetical protein
MVIGDKTLHTFAGATVNSAWQIQYYKEKNNITELNTATFERINTPLVSEVKLNEPPFWPLPKQSLKLSPAREGNEGIDLKISFLPPLWFVVAPAPEWGGETLFPLGEDVLVTPSWGESLFIRYLSGVSSFSAQGAGVVRFFRFIRGRDV